MSGRPIRSSEAMGGMPGTPWKLMSHKKSKAMTVMAAMVAGRESFRKKECSEFISDIDRTCEYRCVAARWR
jgi:hypothetical protein